jgi:hypothetical protein
MVVKLATQSNRCYTFLSIPTNNRASQQSKSSILPIRIKPCPDIEKTVGPACNITYHTLMMFHSPFPVSKCLVNIREYRGKEICLFLEGGKFESSQTGRIGLLGKEGTVI